MRIKPFASLVGLALALTPVVMMALPSAQSEATAKTTLVAQQQAPVVTETRAAPAQAQENTEACRRVRVIAPGYGEPVGERCAATRS